MKLKILGMFAFLSLCTFSLGVYAQSQDYNEGTKEELNQDIDQLYPKRAKAAPAPAEAVSDDQVQAAKPPPVAQQVQVQQAPSQPIYILQQPTNVPQVQPQPSTTVEATAAKESKADALRKQREDLEHQTEDKLTERLEDDRMQSEKDRADRIFKPVPPPAPVVAAPSPAPAPAPVVVAPPPEIVPVTKAKTEDVVPKDDDQSAKFFVGGMAGIGSYPSLSNVNGAYAAGVVGDLELPERIGIEVTALFSNYTLTNQAPSLYSNSYIVNVDQFNITGGANYHFLEGRVSPVAGVLAGYTRRNFSNVASYGVPNSPTGSGAFDGGFKAGIDINATKRLTVGADVRYMMNISYKTDNALAYSNTPYSYVATSPLEASNYYFLTINLKLAL